MMCDPISGERFQDLADLIYWISGRGGCTRQFSDQSCVPHRTQGFRSFLPFFGANAESRRSILWAQTSPPKVGPRLVPGGWGGVGCPPQRTDDGGGLRKGACPRLLERLNLWSPVSQPLPQSSYRSRPASCPATGSPPTPSSTLTCSPTTPRTTSHTNTATGSPSHTGTGTPSTPRSDSSTLSYTPPILLLCTCPLHRFIHFTLLFFWFSLRMLTFIFIRLLSLSVYFCCILF